MSLYLAGTIRHEEERNKDSDIDFFGIVENDFDFGLEDRINIGLEDLKLGIECRFRAFSLENLSGKKSDRPLINFFRPERLVQRFRHFDHIWGKRFDFDKGFVKPMELEDELRHLVESARKMIDDIRNKPVNYPIKDSLKLAFEIARAELQLEGMPYILYRSKMLNEFNRDHIIHMAWKLRNKYAAKQEVIDFMDDLEYYLDYIERMLDADA